MKTNQMIWNIGRYMCLALLVAFAACTRDEFAETTTVQYEKGLCFSLYADGDMQLAGTRSVGGVDALNENLISTVDIFLFKNDGSLNTGGYVHANVTTSDEVVYLYRGRDWLDNFNQQDGPYTVYALANYKGNAVFSAVKSLDDLKAVVAKDEDVVRWEGMGNPAYEGKTFLMDGKIEVTYEKLKAEAAASQSYVADVPLSRAAVKIELTLNFSEGWAKNFMAIGLEAQLSNYASITPVLAEGNPLDGDQRGLSNYPGLLGEAVDNFSPYPVFSKGPTSTYNGSKIRFYTYVNRWDDFINNETMLLIDLPGYYDEDGKPNLQDPTQLLVHNFYKVPIINNAEPQVLQRNTFYQITAVVDMKGTATIDEPEELTEVHFQTAPWTENTVDGGNANAVYLMLNQYHVDIRNADGYDGLEFYSSSPIVSVEIVGFKDQAEAQTAGIDFTYPGEGTEIPSVYFVNKSNERQDVTSQNLVSVTWEEGVVAGKIVLNSPNPDNVTKRYITLKVTNDDKLSKYVVVEQYPLEYIQPIPGYYSYRDDFQTGLYGQTDPCTFESEFITPGNYMNDKWFYIGYPESGTKFYFNSKVYLDDEGKLVRYKFKSEQVDNGFKWTAIPDETDDNEKNNNMMYFVTITQTANQYKIAHPLKDFYKLENILPPEIDYVAVSSEENDKLISPSFMLASQLGMIDVLLGTEWIPSYWEKAREHCAYYVETYRNSKGETVVLDDWRLPTTAEIAIINEYQRCTPDVMDVVLTGSSYCVCWSGANGVGTTPVDGNPEELFGIRCVRDVLPTDEFLQNNN